MNTLKFILTPFFALVWFAAVAQSTVEPPIEDQFDVVTEEWLSKSSFLKTYPGIDEYCQNPVFRKSVNRLLVQVHQYDSIIVATLDDPTAYLGWKMKEEKKTRADIEDFEADYSLTAFIEEMRAACQFRNEIEANADKLRNGVGYESYDAKVLLVETEITRYLNKVDKLIVRIDEHLHMLDLQ